MNEMEELQKRIDQRLAQLERDPSDWRPCAVSIDGGKLRYAELNLAMPEPSLTRFGKGPEREFMPALGEWQMEVDGFVEPTYDVMTFRFGADTVRQPLEGEGYLTRVEPRGITGGWVTYARSSGPLTYHHVAPIDSPSDAT
jgi:hypothetical protein